MAKNTESDTRLLCNSRSVTLPPPPASPSVKWDYILIYVEPLAGLKKLIFVKKDEELHIRVTTLINKTMKCVYRWRQGSPRCINKPMKCVYRWRQGSPRCITSFKGEKQYVGKTYKNSMIALSKGQMYIIGTQNISERILKKLWEWLSWGKR